MVSLLIFFLGVVGNTREALFVRTYHFLLAAEIW